MAHLINTQVFLIVSEFRQVGFLSVVSKFVYYIKKLITTSKKWMCINNNNNLLMLSRDCTCQKEKKKH